MPGHPCVLPSCPEFSFTCPRIPAGAPGSARTAILNFLAAAEPGELRPLLELFLAPLSAAFIRPAAGSADAAAVEAALAQDDPDRCVALKAWGAAGIGALWACVVARFPPTLWPGSVYLLHCAAVRV